MSLIYQKYETGKKKKRGGEKKGFHFIHLKETKGEGWLRGGGMAGTIVPGGDSIKGK